MLLSLLMLAAQPALQPFEFGEFSTATPVSPSWVEEHKDQLCFASSTTNAAHCLALMMSFTGRPVTASLTLVDGKLSKLSIDSKYLDFETVKASLTAKYGSPCRENVWCFKTGELKALEFPFTFPGGRSVSVSYTDTANTETRKPVVPKVDF